jgi:hypothetical protein
MPVYKDIVKSYSIFHDNKGSGFPKISSKGKKIVRGL